MYENNKEDILCCGIKYTMLSLMSNKIKVLIVGGGNAALIKAKTFIKKGCLVSIVAKDFNDGFKELKNYSNLKITKSEYKREYIECNHLVIIATNSEKINFEIRSHCIESYKLYIDCTSPENGLCVTPCQRNTKNIFLGVNTSSGNPRASVYLADKIKDCAVKYDKFIEFTSDLRKRLENSSIKKEIMKFVCSEDFYFFYEKGKEDIVLNMFYMDEYTDNRMVIDFEIKNCNS
ncbi:NAD(P)-dependent oxidoreductase [Clostridium drakei]|uniref:precorrin-2 dehydrogenase n=1 Tax=Clostridium drakei TaxID=332101 RepID=A0A2U8DVD9_9CLOT|nr:NAD(P)-dependent oxidoreductase [Clostridium drakei]AWI06589.1 precorrin-2 dehydrogenase [Clostridium drakei]